ncbi:MAG: hypothetical protein V1672_01965 [Candidatus Diapherotrites archaeon]
MKYNGYHFRKGLKERIEEDTFVILSPLQQKIVFELSEKPLTLSEISNKTGSSVYSIGKQLSVLQCRTQCGSLQRKGINRPLIKKQKEEGIKTTYVLI